MEPMLTEESMKKRLPAVNESGADAFSTLLSLYLSFLYCHAGTWKTPRKKMITNVAQGGL